MVLLLFTRHPDGYIANCHTCSKEVRSKFLHFGNVLRYSDGTCETLEKNAWLCDDCAAIYFPCECKACGKRHPGDNSTYKELCFQCDSRIKDYTSHQRGRARKAGLPCSLTTDEWVETLRDFDFSCAYCGKDKVTGMDHFIAVRFGGGTSRDNCVPACLNCNMKKGRLPFEQAARHISVSALLRAQEYLSKK